MKLIRRKALGLIGSAFAALSAGTAWAADMPAPFDNAGDVKIALVRYLSTGDFFQAYLSGVESQAAALGVDLRVFDSRQDAALQADMVDQAIALWSPNTWPLAFSPIVTALSMWQCSMITPQEVNFAPPV